MSSLLSTLSLLPKLSPLLSAELICLPDSCGFVGIQINFVIDWNEHLEDKNAIAIHT